MLQDHPHACGDKVASISLYIVTRGSSPRVWGQDYTVNPDLSNIGIIPTRVGTSCAVSTSSFIMRDHPHACGDKVLSVSVTSLPPGSSPRVWGQAFLRSEYTASTRIIPTRVGTRKEKAPIDFGLWDQPHACGDKAPRDFVLENPEGSSPRVWGQATDPYQISCRKRIIPTRVGTSIDSLRNCVISKDHPHACGDK